MSSFSTSEMAPKCLIHGHPPFVVFLDEFILAKDQTYVWEPPMEEVRRHPWHANLLFPFLVVGTTFYFKDPIPEASKLRECFDNFFPSFPKEN